MVSAPCQAKDALHGGVRYVGPGTKWPTTHIGHCHAAAPRSSDCRSTSRILALNIRGGGGTRSTAICQFLDAHDPDVVVLTEWRASAAAMLSIAGTVTRRGINAR